jgi:hypothetical protein
LLLHDSFVDARNVVNQNGAKKLVNDSSINNSSAVYFSCNQFARVNYVYFSYDQFARVNDGTSTNRRNHDNDNQTNDNPDNYNQTNDNHGSNSQINDQRPGPESIWFKELNMMLRLMGPIGLFTTAESHNKSDPMYILVSTIWISTF